jgi:hypothetical protein
MMLTKRAHVGYAPGMSKDLQDGLTEGAAK